MHSFDSGKVLRNIGAEGFKKLEQFAASQSSGFSGIEKKKESLNSIEAELLRKSEQLRERESSIIRVTEESRGKGFEQGREEGYKEGFETARQEAKLLAEVTLAMQSELRAIQTLLSDRVMRLVLTASRQVIMQHIDKVPDSVANLLKEAVRTISSEIAFITVSANRWTIDIINKHIQDLGPLSTELLKSVDVVYKEDDRLVNGGFIITHSGGRMDYSIENRWKNVIGSLSNSESDLEYRTHGQ